MNTTQPNKINLDMQSGLQSNSGWSQVESSLLWLPTSTVSMVISSCIKLTCIILLEEITDTRNQSIFTRSISTTKMIRLLNSFPE